jgi:hypothetical protein
MWPRGCAPTCDLSDMEGRHHDFIVPSPQRSPIYEGVDSLTTPAVEL